jgi:hypothetical protein
MTVVLFIVKVAVALVVLALLKRGFIAALHRTIERRKLCMMCAREPQWIFRLANKDFRMCDPCSAKRLGATRELMWSQGKVRRFVRGECE